MKSKYLLGAMLLMGGLVICFLSFGGSTMVYYGRPSGGGCSGTGICSMGANNGGVTTDFSYVGNSNGSNVLTMSFNYTNARQAEFTPDKSGNTYTFTAGYVFSDSAMAAQCGVPKGYAIPVNFVATYNPPVNGSNCSVVITQKNP